MSLQSTNYPNNRQKLTAPEQRPLTGVVLEVNLGRKAIRHNAEIRGINGAWEFYGLAPEQVLQQTPAAPAPTQNYQPVGHQAVNLEMQQDPGRKFESMQPPSPELLNDLPDEVPVDFDAINREMHADAFEHADEKDDDAARIAKLSEIAKSLAS